MNEIRPRNLLWYFLRSKLWVTFAKDRTFNYMYQMENDPERAGHLLMASDERYEIRKRKEPNAVKRIGIHIDDYIYDMYDCVFDSGLAPKTKMRLYDELDELEKFHKGKGTWHALI